MSAFGKARPTAASYRSATPVTPTQIAQLAVERARLRRQAATDSPLTRLLAPDADPIAFYTDALGVVTLYQKQQEMVRAVHTHRRVSVVGANSSGKDFVSGRLVLDWLHRYVPSKVIIIGPTDRQVKHVVWAETRQAFNRALLTLPGRMLPVAAEYHLGDQHYAMGFATDEPYNVQGFHSPDLLVILTEAHAISQEHIDAVKRLNPRAILMTGNPLTSDGEFYGSHHERREDWYTIQISAFDTPNLIEGRTVVPGLVTQDDIDSLKTDWGEENPLYIASVLGQFPQGLSLGVVSLEEVRAAQALKATPDQLGVLALDVGGGQDGGDKTVLAARFGPVVKILYKAQGESTRQTTRRVYDSWWGPLQHRLTHVIVDGNGIGAGVVDGLRELGVPVVNFNAGSNAQSSHYANRGAEVWGRLASAIRKGEVSLPDDRSLTGQLVGRKFLLTPGGKTALESKRDMARRGRRSPDEADAVAMTYALAGPAFEDSSGLASPSRWAAIDGRSEAFEVRSANGDASVRVGEFLEPLPEQPSRWRFR